MHSQWARGIMSQDFVVLDTETNGFGRDAEICEISILSKSGDMLLETLVDIDGDIPEDARAVHGISKRMLEGAPRFHQIHHYIRQFAGNKIVLAFNVDFDRRMIQQNCDMFNLPQVVADWQCIMKEYSSWKKIKQWQKLSKACELEGITVKGAHSTGQDCLMALNLVKHMAGENESKSLFGEQ